MFYKHSDRHKYILGLTKVHGRGETTETVQVVLPTPTFLGRPRGSSVSNTTRKSNI